MFNFLMFLFLCFYFWDKFFFLLILMEGLMVFMFIGFFLYSSFWFFSFEVVFLFMSMMVLEGVFGLSLIIYMVMKIGNDKYSIVSFF